jgi:hypothetical protein
MSYPATSLAPQDVLKSIENDANKERAYQANLVQEALRAEQERALLQKKVYDLSNPSPIFMTVLVVAVVLLMYLIYVLFLKPCMSGEWMDHAGNTWQISHNRFNGNLRVRINGECRGSGKVLDNYVNYGDLIGVWNYGNVIVFTEGWHLERVI